MPAERVQSAASPWPHVFAGCGTPQVPSRCSGDLGHPLLPQRQPQPIRRLPMLPVHHSMPPMGSHYHPASSGSPGQAGPPGGYMVPEPVVSTAPPLQQQQQPSQYRPHQQYMDGSQLPMFYARDPALQLGPCWAPPTPAGGSRRSSTTVSSVSLPPPAAFHMQQGFGHSPYPQPHQHLGQQAPRWSAGAPQSSMAAEQPCLTAAAIKLSPGGPRKGAPRMKDSPKPAAARAATAAAASMGEASEGNGDAAAGGKRGKARKVTDRERFDTAVTELEARKESLLQLVSNLERSNAGLRRLEAKQAAQLAGQDTAIRRLWLLQETSCASSLQHQQQVEQGAAATEGGGSSSSSAATSLPGSCVVLLEVPLAPGLAAVLQRQAQAVPREPLTNSQLLAKLCGVGPTLLEAAGGNVVTALVTHLEEQQLKGHRAAAAATAITGARTVVGSSAAGEYARAEAAGCVLQLWQQLVKALAEASSAAAAAGDGSRSSRDQQQILAVTRSLLWHLLTAEASLVVRVMSAGHQPGGQQLLTAAEQLPAGVLAALDTAAAAAAGSCPSSSIQEVSEGGTEDFCCFAVPGSPVRPPAAAADCNSFTGPLQFQQGLVLSAPASGAAAAAGGLASAMDEDVFLDQFLDNLLDGAAGELAADEQWRGEAFLCTLPPVNSSSCAWGPGEDNSGLFSSQPLLPGATCSPLGPPAAGAGLASPISPAHPVLSRMHLTMTQVQDLTQTHQLVTSQQQQQLQQLGGYAAHHLAAVWQAAPSSSSSSSSRWTPVADVVEGAADPVSALLAEQAAGLRRMVWGWLGTQSPLSAAQQASCLVSAYPAFPDILSLSEALQAHHQTLNPSHAYISSHSSHISSQLHG